MSDIKPKPKRNEKGQFLKGNLWQGNPGGRPRGSRPKLAESFIADVYEHWLLHGAEAINRVWKIAPVDYLKVVASILPKDLNVNISIVEAMNDDELSATILELLADPELAASGKTEDVG